MTRPFVPSAFVVLLSVFPAFSVAASAQSTALVVHSEPGDFIGGGLSQAVTDLDAAFAVTRNVRNGISVDVDGGVASLWQLRFSLPNSRQITPGHYAGGTKYGVTPFVGMSVSRSDHACNELTGRYLVREVAYGAAGEVLQLAIDVEQHCGNATPALFAAVRYNSTIPPDLFPGESARYAMTMTASSGGLVTGGGLACGAGETACTTTFASATPVTLVAIPSDGYIFNGWSGGCSGGATTTLMVNTVKECGAAFTPALPALPRTRLATSSSHGGPLPQGEEIHTFANSRWSLTTGNDGNDLSFQVEGLGQTTSVTRFIEFRAPAGAVLQRGYYPHAVAAATRTTQPGFLLHGAGACSSVSAEFTVHQYVRNPSTGEVIAFAADFVERCGGPATPPLTGRIEYWATYEIPSACATPDPFSGMGGGTCYNGGWLPPGMPIPAGATPPPAAPAPPPTPAPAPASSSCATPDPFAAIGGGTCYGGGWLPPGMPVPADAVPSPAAPPAPAPVPPPAPPSVGTCSTPDPFTVLGGGTCHNGGWLPPGMPIPGGGLPPGE